MSTVPTYAEIDRSACRYESTMGLMDAAKAVLDCDAQDLPHAQHACRMLLLARLEAMRRKP